MTDSTTTRAKSTKKPTTRQAEFMNAILKHGGDQVPGTQIFGRNEILDRQTTKTVTIDSCKHHGWVRRDERDGLALWTVTADGRAALERI